jgi:hypothetical protein
LYASLYRRQFDAAIAGADATHGTATPADRTGDAAAGPDGAQPLERWIDPVLTPEQIPET